MTDSPQPGTRGRSPAWMVILCICMGIAVVGVMIGVPYYRQYRAVTYIQSVRGNFDTEPGGPEWLRRCVGDEGMQVFDRVTGVMLFPTGSNDTGLVHLRGLANLESLWLWGSGFTDAGLVHLSALTKLKKLELGETRVSEKGVEALKKALPGCQIDWDRN